MTFFKIKFEFFYGSGTGGADAVRSFSFWCLNSKKKNQLITVKSLELKLLIKCFNLLIQNLIVHGLSFSVLKLVHKYLQYYKQITKNGSVYRICDDVKLCRITRIHLTPNPIKHISLKFFSLQLISHTSQIILMRQIFMLLALFQKNPLLKVCSLGLLKMKKNLTSVNTICV